MSGIQHFAPRIFGFLDVHPGARFWIDPSRALHPHGLKRPNPALVTSASSLDPLTNPRLLLGQLAIEFTIRQTLGRQRCCTPFKELCVIAWPAAQLAAIYLDNTGSQALKKSPIMGNKQHGTRKTGETPLQPRDGLEIQVISRLVE